MKKETFIKYYYHKHKFKFSKFIIFNSDNVINSDFYFKKTEKYI